MAVVPSEIEGTISKAKLLGGAAELLVMGVRVLVPAGTPIASPTNPGLTPADLASAAKFPGRDEDGFVGGTATVEGSFDTTALLLTADKMSVEPAENLLLGALTAAVPLAINGVPVEVIADGRMPGGPVRNEFGFAAKVTPALVDTPAAAEGYFAKGVFRAHTVEVDGSAELVSSAPQLAITRAKVRDNDPAAPAGYRVDVRGSVTMTHAADGVTQQEIHIYRVDPAGETKIGIEPAARDGDFPRFATWRLDADFDPVGDPVLDKAPTVIRAENASPNALAASDETATDGR